MMTDPEPKRRWSNMTRKCVRLLRSVSMPIVSRALGDADGNVTLRILRGPARGLKIKVNLSRPENAFFTGSHEEDQVKRLAELCQRGMTVWDCGAHIGYYTLVLARLVGPEGRVVSFEPDPNNFRRLEQNIQINGLSQVHPVHTAIGGPVDNITLVCASQQISHVFGTYVGSGVHKGAEKPDPSSLVQVPCLTLDQAYERFGAPDLIKIDIEGAEEIAFQHAHNLTSEKRPTLIVEIHNFECDRAAWAFADRHGYEIRELLTDEAIRRNAALTPFVSLTPCRA